MQHARSTMPSPKLYSLTIVGGLAFWVLTFAVSLLPIAAEYRAAYSNWSVRTVWVASLVIGIIVAWCVSHFLLRSIGKSPGKDPLWASVNLSLTALAIATVLVDVPRSMNGRSDGLYYFLIGLAFNAVRFVGLGLAIGYAYKRSCGSMQLAGYSLFKGDKK